MAVAWTSIFNGLTAASLATTTVSAAVVTCGAEDEVSSVTTPEIDMVVIHFVDIVSL